MIPISVYTAIPPGHLSTICFKSSLRSVVFFTWEIFAWRPVPASSVSASSVSASSIPTSSVPASSVPIVGHAGHAAHGLSRCPEVSGPPAALLRLSAEASLGDLVPGAPVVATFPSLAAIEPVKPIPVTITPISVAATLAAGA